MLHRLTIEQDDAVFQLLECILAHQEDEEYSVTRLTGGAGTGKTTAACHLRKELVALGYQVYGVAPTNQAVHVFQEKMASGEALSDQWFMTVHRLIGLRLVLNPETGKYVLVQSGEGKLKGARPVVIIDEVSQVNARLSKAILQLPAHVVLVGDPGQLTPVKEDFSPLLKCDVDSEFNLKNIMRQGEGSTIIDLASSIRCHGAQELRSWPANGEDVVRCEEGSHVSQWAHLWQELPHDPYHARIVCYANKTRRNHNRDIRRALGLGPVPEDGEFMLMLSPINSVLKNSHGGGWTLLSHQEVTVFWNEARHMKAVYTNLYNVKEDRIGGNAAYHAYMNYMKRDHRVAALHTSALVRVEGFSHLAEKVVSADYDHKMFERVILPGFQLEGLHIHGTGYAVSDPFVASEDTRRVLGLLKQQVKKESARVKKARKAFGNLSIGFKDHSDMLYDLWRSYFGIESSVFNADYAYASTTHKAQGSTFTNVILDPEVSYKSKHPQKLAYTAATRASNRVIIL